MEVGGSIENMETACWMAAIMIPGDSIPWCLKGFWWSNLALEESADISWFLLVDRSLPRTIIVDSTGHRFTNEAAPYLDVVKAQLRRHREGYGAIPAFLIADQRYHLRYPMGPVMPGLPTRKYERSGLVMKAPTLDELAEKCTIDPPGLLREDKSPIDELYATGNCSASATSDTYPGAGGTIGPAMAFASLAARHAVCGDGWVRDTRTP